MGSPDQHGSLIVVFAVCYFSIITLAYSLVSPDITCNSVNCSGNGLNSVGLGSNIGFGNFITNFKELGALNLIIFAPVLIALLYIVGVLAIPTWV